MMGFLQISEHSSLTAIAEDHNIPYHTLMALQRNNKAHQHTLVLGRFCSTTESSRLPCRYVLLPLLLCICKAHFRWQQTCK